LGSVDRNVAEMADGGAGASAAICGMVHTIENRDVVEVEWTDAFEAGHIDTVLGVVGTTPVEGINAALLTKVVFGGAGVELEAAVCIFALLDGDAIEQG